jgi:hypothetical protein
MSKQMIVSKKLKKVTASDVVNAYKFILGRLPENGAVIKNRLGKITLEELRRDLLVSDEFETLHSQRNFQMHIEKRSFKAALNLFLKSKLTSTINFIKKHPSLLRFSRFILQLLPKRIEKRLRNLQTAKANISLLVSAGNSSHSATPNDGRAIHIYDQLNAACKRVHEKGKY